MKNLLIISTLLIALNANAFARGRIQNEDVKSKADITSSAATITGNLTMSSACISSPSSTANIAVGQYVYDTTTSAHIPSGTTVAGLPGTCSSGQIQMSASAAGAGTGETITFGGSVAQLINDSKIYVTASGINMLLSDAISGGQIGGSGSSPSITVYTSGSGTYNATGAHWLKIRMAGGGGGGAGGYNGSSPGTGGTGGTTTFGSILSATGGTGGVDYDTPGGPGTATVTSPAIALISLSGQYGGSAPNQGIASDVPMGGPGGSNPFSGGGMLQLAHEGTSGTGQANTGGGGSGGGGPTSGLGGSGGGAGAYIEAIVPSGSVASSYAYSVGSGGTGGTPNSGGATGGAGGSGIIIIEKY